jgi:hypothetical protein
VQTDTFDFGFNYFHLIFEISGGAFLEGDSGPRVEGANRVSGASWEPLRRTALGCWDAVLGTRDGGRGWGGAGGRARGVFLWAGRFRHGE